MNKFLLLLLLAPGLAMSATYKCQGADGKMEFMDRPCDTNKKSIEAPKAATSIVITPLDQLQTLFNQYETPLCERETLMTQIDIARRSEANKKAPDVWKKKQERLDELNDMQIEFRSKTAKFTQANAADGSPGPEATALLRFQSKVRTCAKEATANSASAAASEAVPATVPAAASAKPAAVVPAAKK